MDGEQIARIKHDLKGEGYHIYVYSYPGGMFFAPHKHDHDTLHIMLSGRMIVHMNGEEHALEPGERFVVPAHVMHSAEVIGDMPVVCIDATRAS
jgi:mannose-6-phosphate isomerase-like protein (cupin superfamily)